ncbi:juvenile hormone acid O-methyltransferase-like isoform X2 [Trichoplusia ni]|uniref:Juvenile hormone acid O-methyltransferase-like isoform X2 n=1 Tax=Trichoplusia ni TaxID=7111 RepID=A0A7E5VXH6_TRINI|nr:juvenile hormone acid O-methyltransferase-like isoform X2 [Trichoplusia ni]
MITTTMNHPDMYNISNAIQKKAAIQCLDEFGKKINWSNNGDNAVDLGCGDGSVTNILKKYMPRNYRKLVACDISEKAVKYANEHHSDENTSFRVLDIEGELPEEMRGEFNHVFSFYALHWIHDQEKAFRNIYSLLSDGGDCLLTFLGYMPCYSVYSVLSRCNKWESWLKDIDLFISPYHTMQDPDIKVKEMMEEIGFRNINVTCKEMLYVFDSVEAIKNTVKAIEPFDMPKDVYEDFMQDYYAVAQELGLMEINNNNVGESSINCSYCLLVVCASK